MHAAAMVWFFGDGSPRQQEMVNALYPGSSKQAPNDEEAVPRNRAAQAGAQAEMYATKKTTSPTQAKGEGGSSSTSIVPYSVRARPATGRREARVSTAWTDAPKRAGGSRPLGTAATGGKQQMASEADGGGGAAPPKNGLPPSKQAQQEEVLAPLDEEEREALERRMLRSGAGRFATARPGAMKYGMHGVHSSRGQSGIPAAPTGADASGAARDVPSGTDGWGVGVSGRLGYERGNAGYSSRVPGGLANTGYLSPSRMRAQALTARAQQEQNERQRWEAAQKEKARLAAMRAAAYSSRLTEQENERKMAARRALEQKERLAKERAMLAAQSARKATEQGLGKLNIGKAINLAQPSGRHGKPVRRKKPPRPEWGSGHAGGARMKKDLRVFTPMHASAGMSGFPPEPQHAVRV